MRLRVCSAALVGLIAIHGLSVSAQVRPGREKPLVPPTPSIYELLDRYTSGDVTAARTFARTVTEKQVRAMEDQSGRWIDANPARRSQRRLAAATFVLDAAREWQGTANWHYARRLISWACHGFASAETPPQAGEQLWFQASVALIGGAEDWWFLLGKSGLGNARKGGKAPLDDEVFRGHLAHAMTRFPDDAKFALASAVSIESLSWEVGALGRDPNRRGMVAGEIEPDVLARSGAETDGARTGSPEPRRALIANQGVAEVRRVGRRFDSLVTQPQIAAEAHVRAGLVSFRMSNGDQAISHLSQAVTLTEDPYLVYLSRLIEGVVRERQGRDDEAIAAYRAALQAVPRAHTASTMLAARLIKMGRLTEASEVAEVFFAPGPPAVDPWRFYRLGDFRSWPAIMKQLRAEFQ